MRSRYFHCFCRNCSNAEYPELRPHELKDDILTCLTCGKRLKTKELDGIFSGFFYLEELNDR